jgi:hypothetical protein
MSTLRRWTTTGTGGPSRGRMCPRGRVRLRARSCRYVAGDASVVGILDPDVVQLIEDEMHRVLARVIVPDVNLLLFDYAPPQLGNL